MAAAAEAARKWAPERALRNINRLQLAPAAANVQPPPPPSCITSQCALCVLFEELQLLRRLLEATFSSGLFRLQQEEPTTFLSPEQRLQQAAST